MLAILLLASLALPYLVLNVRRLLRGQRWAITYCAMAREWQERAWDEARARKAGAGER